MKRARAQTSCQGHALNGVGRSISNLKQFSSSSFFDVGKEVAGRHVSLSMLHVFCFAVGFLLTGCC
jgi:hypothetical protein